MSVEPPGLTDDEQLLLTLLALTDEKPMEGWHAVGELAERLGWTPVQVDVCAQGLERRGMVSRIVTMDGTPWARSIGPTDAAFFWSDRQSPRWPEMKALADSWVRARDRGAPLDSNSLAQHTGMHQRSAAALMSACSSRSHRCALAGAGRCPVV